MCGPLRTPRTPSPSPNTSSSRAASACRSALCLVTPVVSGTHAACAIASQYVSRHVAYLPQPFWISEHRDLPCSMPSDAAGVGGHDAAMPSGTICNSDRPRPTTADVGARQDLQNITVQLSVLCKRQVDAMHSIWAHADMPMSATYTFAVSPAYLATEECAAR